MGRLVRGLALAIVTWGLSGCGGGIKEGGPPPDAGYTAPAESAETAPPKGGAAR